MASDFTIHGMVHGIAKKVNQRESNCVILAAVTLSIKEHIKTLASGLGYRACGIAGVEPFAEYRAALRTLAERFPETAGLYGRWEHRTDPTTRVPWARSIVVCIRRYGKYEIPESLARHIGRSYLCDRRISACPDHAMPKRMKEGLQSLGLRVRTGGVPSRDAAVRAGVARIAKNGFAVAEGCGSWLNIESWMVDAALEPDSPTPSCPCPAGCQACLNVCPTKALVDPFVMDMKRCIAHLTYEAPFPIRDDLWKKMGPWIYGCDDCQRVCPLNHDHWSHTEPAPWITDVAGALTPEALSTMDQETYARVVHPLFDYIPLGDLARWQANARRALESIGAPG